MLTAVRKQQLEHRRILVAGLADVRRAGRRSSRTAARMLASYQGEIMAVAVDTMTPILAEQGIPTQHKGAAHLPSLLTGMPAASMLEKAATAAAFDSLVLALLSDASRTATAVTAATYPAVTGYVRVVSPPCCGRCAVLAGRVYRYSQGFQRHPRCDCTMTPTTTGKGRDLTTNPDALFRAGGIQGLSRADTKALNLGVDLGQVVNVRRKAAGLMEGSSVMVRAGQPTPEFLMRVASDDAEAVSLLARYGYIT